MPNIATVSIHDMEQALSGDGVININNNTAVIDSTAGTSSAYLFKIIKARAGEKITVSCLARKITGEDGNSSAIFIDFPTSNAIKNRVEINSKYWQRYSCSFTVPYTATLDSHVKCSVGSHSALGGSIEVTDISIHASKAVSPVLWAAGLISLKNGVAAINENFISAGIESLNYDSTSKSLKIKIPSCKDYSNLGPIIQVNLTHDKGINYQARSGGYDRNTGEFTVKFIDTTLTPPSIVDVSSEPTLYVWVNALGA